MSGLILGLHLLSLHVPHNADLREVNPGVYARMDGFTAGAYANSIGRLSVYAGYTVETPDQRFALTVGAVSGYRRLESQVDCNALGVSSIRARWPYCYTESGSSQRTWAPLLAPSIRAFELDGIVGRVTWLPKLGHGTVNTLHFSLEKTY